MSKVVTRNAAAIAEEAIDQVGLGIDHFGWLETLFGAIQLDAKHNQGRSIAELATMGQYLAMDAANLLDSCAGELKSQLQTVEHTALSRNTEQEETVH